MSRRATPQQIEQFHSDRKQLPHNNKTIAALMKVDEANYSKYMNGHMPITAWFLGRFYKTFRTEFSHIKLNATKTFGWRVGPPENEGGKPVDDDGRSINWSSNSSTREGGSQRATPDEINTFVRDRDLLLMTDAEIARRMGLDRSNFSSYVTGRFPITRRFLRRFYGVFGREINAAKGFGNPLLWETISRKMDEFLYLWRIFGNFRIFPAPILRQYGGLTNSD